MTVQIYGLKACDTCRKAVKALPDAVLVDVREEPLGAETLAAWLAQFGPDKLVNTRSTTWRGLEDAERAKLESEEGALALLQAHPTLMKRPVIVTQTAVHLGWTKDVQAQLVG
jgi:arsenate reductase